MSLFDAYEGLRPKSPVRRVSSTAFFDGIKNKTETPSKTTPQLPAPTIVGPSLSPPAQPQGKPLPPALPAPSPYVPPLYTTEPSGIKDSLEHICDFCSEGTSTVTSGVRDRLREFVCLPREEFNFLEMLAYHPLMTSVAMGSSAGAVFGITHYSNAMGPMTYTAVAVGGLACVGSTLANMVRTSYPVTLLGLSMTMYAASFAGLYTLMRGWATVLQP